MSQAPIFPMAVDAMIADTLHLSRADFGSYHLLLYATWRANGKALVDDDAMLARICRMSNAEWKVARPILAAFFDTSDGTWRQKRLEKEWVATQKRILAARENGKGGGRPKKPTDNPVGSQRVSSGIGQEKAIHSHIQTAPIEPNGSNGAGRAADPAIQLIEAFDRCRALAYGQNRRRPFPASMDSTTAQRWQAAGLDVVMFEASLLPKLQSMQAKGQDPPNNLKYLDQFVADLLVEAKRPMPDGVRNVQRPHNGKQPSGYGSAFSGFPSAAETLDADSF